MSILGVIPARYASTRFPGKPLADIAGTSMIHRVYEQTLKAKGLAQVVVATDDERILAHVAAFGGHAVMTRADHPTGTDRLGEVAHLRPEFSHYINIQGDEPFIDPGQIDAVCQLLREDPNVEIATLVRPMTELEDLLSPNTAKVVLDKIGNALYFSRSPIPHLRGVAQEEWLQKHDFWQHIGLYGFTRIALLQVVELPMGKLEKAESLEQLRWLEAGFRIRTGVSAIPSYGIDVPEDIPRVLGLLGLR